MGASRRGIAAREAADLSERAKLDPSDPRVQELRAKVAEARRLTEKGIAKSVPHTFRQRKLAHATLALIDRFLAVLDGRDSLPDAGELDPVLLWRVQQDYERAAASGHREEAREQLAAFVRALTRKPKGRPRQITQEMLRRMWELKAEGWPDAKVAKELGVPRQRVTTSLRHHYGVRPRKK